MHTNRNVNKFVPNIEEKAVRILISRIFFFSSWNMGPTLYMLHWYFCSVYCVLDLCIIVNFSNCCSCSEFATLCKVLFWMKNIFSNGQWTYTVSSQRPVQNKEWFKTSSCPSALIRWRRHVCLSHVLMLLMSKEPINESYNLLVVSSLWDAAIHLQTFTRIHFSVKHN